MLKEDKAEYIQALIDTRDSEDLNVFLDCMARHHCQHLQADIDQFIRSTSEEGGQKTTQKTTRKTTLKTAIIILEAIKNEPTISRTKLAEQCGITPDGIKWQMKKLQERGVLKRVGPDKGGHWEIIEVVK